MKLCSQCESGFPDHATTCPTHGGILGEIRELKPGLLVHKTYRIVRKLGQGGMGTVYLADHLFMEEPRALKFLSPELSRDAAFTSRFRREVRTLRQLRHKNIVDCGDLEPAEDDSLFFPMEFVNGPDLRDFLRNAPQPFPIPLALSIARQITEGLGAAHALGMVHRDIKPENILMSYVASGTGAGYVPKIADFGIVATKESANSHTRTGVSLLTMAYASPEQWRGMRAAELDGRTDLYALGGVLFEMLTGQTAFEAESYEGWGEHHRFTIPLPPSKIRPELAEWRGLDDLVVRLLAKDRDQRPYDVAEVLRLLDAVEFVPTPVRKPEPPPPPAPPIPVAPPPVPVKRVPSWLWIAGVLLIVIAAFSAGRLLNSNNAQDNPTQNTTQNQQADHTQPEQPQSETNSPQPGSGSQTAESPKPSHDTQPSFSQINPQPNPQTNPQPNAPARPASSASAAALDTQAEGYYTQKNYTEAAPLFDQSCSGGSLRACTFLGFMYERGQGVGRDPERAVRLYTTACDGNFATACRDLGPVYTDGEPGIAKDEARGASYNLKACNLNEFDGCAGAGWDYYRGIGVTQDFQRAAALLTKSCDGNSPYGCNDLGVLYNRGEGETEDQAKAAALFQKACTGGDAHGCSNLGDSYRYGRGGLPVDTAKAKELLSKGCSMGNQWGCDQLKQMQ